MSEVPDITYPQGKSMDDSTDPAGDAQKTIDAFKEQVLNSKTPVFVEVAATWCGNCIAQAPNVEKLADQAGNSMKVIKIDFDKFNAAMKTLPKDDPLHQMWAEKAKNVDGTPKTDQNGDPVFVLAGLPAGMVFDGGERKGVTIGGPQSADKLKTWVEDEALHRKVFPDANAAPAAPQVKSQMAPS